MLLKVPYYNILDCKYNPQQQHENRHDNIPYVLEEVKFLFYNCNLYTKENDKVKLDKHDYHRISVLEDCNKFFNIAIKYMRQAEDILYTDSINIRIIDIRIYVITLLAAIRAEIFDKSFIISKETYIKELKRNLKRFKRSIIDLKVLDNNVLLKLIICGLKQCNSSLSYYTHLRLDVFWLLITINYLLHEDIEDDIKHFLQELYILYLKSSEKHAADDCSFNLGCPCFKSMWLRLQLLCENNYINFWNIFNKISVDNTPNQLLVLNEVATLHCYNDNGSFIGADNHRLIENYDFLNDKWTQILKTNLNHTDLFKLMSIVAHLVTKLWLQNATLQFYYTSWDYFYKQLENIDLKMPNNLENMINYIERIRNVNNLENSYEYFTYMFYKHLNHHHQHWSKFRGRIYMKFSSAKRVNLSNKGLFNISLFLLTLSDVSFNEISLKLLEILQALPRNAQQLIFVWNIYATLLYFYLKADKNIEEPIKPLQYLLCDASMNRQQYNLIAEHVGNMNYLFSINENCFLGQALLIGSWLERYIQHCQYFELCTLVDVLITILDRVVTSNAWPSYENYYLTYVLPGLKRLSINSKAYPPVGHLTALIATNSNNILNQNVQFYATDNINPVLYSPFCITVLRYLHDNYLITSQITNNLLKIWTQHSLIGQTSDTFTKLLFSLDTFNFLSDSLHLDTKEPLKWFILAIAETASLQKSNICAIKDILQTSFGSLEKFLLKQFQSSKDNCLQIYTYFALLISACGYLLYSKSSPQSILTQLIDILLLPSDLLRGKPPSEHILIAIEHTWHLYLKSFYKLLGDGDAYIERICKDLVIRYLPYFKSRERDFNRLVDQPDLLSFALQKISNEYFSSNTYNEELLLKPLTLLKYLIIMHGTKINILTTIISIVLPGIFYCYMFKNLKGPSVEIFKSLVKTSCYQQSLLHDQLSTCLVDLTNKYVAFNANSYFQLMMVLYRIFPIDVKRIFPQIKTAVLAVESKRGLGFDTSLRQGLDRIAKALD